MIRFVRQLVTSIGTYGTLLALVYSLKQTGRPFTRWQGVLLLVGIALLAADLGFIVRDYVKRPQRRFRRTAKQERRIRDFMHAWLGSNGRVAVFSRDLSWVKHDDHALRELLLAKARARELTVVVPAPTPLTDNLAVEGAEIVTYPDLDFVIQSRFTLIGLGRTGGRVAIGHTQDGVHVIDQLDAPDPAFFMANDLVEVMRRIAMKRPA
jgi:hypothetical protein